MAGNDITEIITGGGDGATVTGSRFLNLLQVLPLVPQLEAVL